MVATSALIYRMDLHLTSLLAHVQDLPDLQDEWGTLEEHVQVSASLNWDHLMADILAELDEHYRADEMPPEQAARYRDLLCKLKAALPIIDQLRFWRPQVSLEP